jgi:4-diphosphocytidyl-2-C-methyl-D-erythritol kinase
VEPIDFKLEGKYVVVVNPGIHISTAQAFQGIQPKSSDFDWKEFIKHKDFEKVELRNDFEQSVFQLYPEIAEIKSTLLQVGALYSSMSGTGSTVYGIFEKDPQLKWDQNYFSRTFLL